MRTSIVGAVCASVYHLVLLGGGQAHAADGERSPIVYRVDIPGVTPDAEDWVTVFDVDEGVTSIGTIGPGGFRFIGPDSNVSNCAEPHAGCLLFGGVLIVDDRYPQEARGGVKVSRYPHLGCTLTTIDVGDGGTTKSVYCPGRGVVEWSVFHGEGMTARYSLLSSYGLLSTSR